MTPSRRPQDIRRDLDDIKAGLLRDEKQTGVLTGIVRRFPLSSVTAALALGFMGTHSPATRRRLLRLGRLGVTAWLRRRGLLNLLAG